MLDTTTDGYVTAPPGDGAGPVQEAGKKVEFYLSDVDWKVLQQAAWIDGRTEHQQAKVFVRQKLGVFEVWKPPVAPAPDASSSDTPTRPSRSARRRR